MKSANKGIGRKNIAGQNDVNIEDNRRKNENNYKSIQLLPGGC